MRQSQVAFRRSHSSSAHPREGLRYRPCSLGLTHLVSGCAAGYSVAQQLNTGKSRCGRAFPPTQSCTEFFSCLKTESQAQRVEGRSRHSRASAGRAAHWNRQALSSSPGPRLRREELPRQREGRGLLRLLTPHSQHRALHVQVEEAHPLRTVCPW